MSVRRRRVILGRLLLAAVLLVGAVTLTAPWALGWPPANERQAILTKAFTGIEGGRSAIKLVPATDLPASANVLPSWQLGNVWVVALSGYRLAPTSHASAGSLDMTGSVDACFPRCAPPAWTVEVFSEDSQMPVGGVGGTTGSWPPFFDRLPDRSTPWWWPVPVPSLEVAAPLLLAIASLIALVFLGAMSRGIGRALSRGFRRQGRPT